MAEHLNIPGTGNRKDIYESLLPQVDALTSGENDFIANLSNIAAALKYSLNFLWVGFYIVNDHELVLGPFQGPVACTRIAEGKGVCGTSMKNRKPIIVPDVNKFPGHIACSTESRSEIVIPAIVNDQVILVMDIDSDKLNDFGQADLEFFNRVITLVEKLYRKKA